MYAASDLTAMYQAGLPQALDAVHRTFQIGQASEQTLTEIQQQVAPKPAGPAPRFPWATVLAFGALWVLLVGYHQIPGLPKPRRRRIITRRPMPRRGF